MADVNAKVMSMVQDEIRKNPDVTTPSLFEKAKKMDKSIASLSPRQFNARYPLQVKRKLSPKRGGRRRTAAKKSPGRRGRKVARATTGNGGGRNEIRQVMLQFAKDLSKAEETAELVGVIADVDKYVDRIEKATR